MAASSTTLANVTFADWSMALDSTEGGSPGAGLGKVVQGLADVDQCISIILTTPKGSDPLRPTFGANIWQYIDFPINAALPAIVREVTEALTLWEPRVKLIAVTATPTIDTGPQLTVSVTWQLNLTGTSANNLPSQTTTLTIPTSNQ